MTLRPWSAVPGHNDWRDAVLARYGLVCWLQLDGCTTHATTADHVIPRSERPDLELDVDNGRPACLNCNRRRRNRPAPSIVQTVDRLGLLAIDRLELLGPE
jgi:5-methylcytosine-specific restriction endonuclease McrA